MATQQTEEVEGAQTPSDFRVRDYGLGEVLFRYLGFNVCMLHRKWWGEVNSSEELSIDLGLKSDISDSYDVFDGNRVENAVKDTKLVPRLVGNELNLNSFSLKHYHYLKRKMLVQKKYLTIGHKIEERHKEML